MNPTTEVGLVVDVQGNFDIVESFTLRTQDGEDLVLIPAADGSFDFPLSHLRAHMVGLHPVRVVVEDGTDGVLTAVSISDA